MAVTITFCDQAVPADSAPHDVTIPGSPGLASIVEAKQLVTSDGVASAAETDLSVVTAITGDDQILLKDKDTVTLQVGAAIAAKDFIQIVGEVLGENVKVA